MNNFFYREVTDLKEIQQILLEIFVVFKEYCEMHGLRYFLTGGTLLGAVRHKGFIPWDDDLDVMMPRPDYERLIKLSQGKINERFEVWHPENIPDYPRLYMRVVDNNTVLDEFYLKNPSRNCLGIDVFPMDGIPSDMSNRKRYFKKIRIYRRIFILAHSRLFRGMCFTKVFIKSIAKVVFFLMRDSNLYIKIRNLVKKYPFEKSENIGITTGYYSEKEVIKAEMIRNIQKLEFEGIKVPAVENFGQYLINLYGINYMMIPSLEERKRHHTFSVWKKYSC